MMPDHQGDHGEFTVKTTRNEDLKILRQGIRKARKNPTKPGHYWQRMVVKQEGTPIEVVKMYHIDLNAGVVVVTETRNGQETARRTVDLADLG